MGLQNVVIQNTMRRICSADVQQRDFWEKFPVLSVLHLENLEVSQVWDRSHRSAWLKYQLSLGLPVGPWASHFSHATRDIMGNNGTVVLNCIQVVLNTAPGMVMTGLLRYVGESCGDWESAAQSLVSGKC